MKDWRIRGNEYCSNICDIFGKITNKGHSLKQKKSQLRQSSIQHFSSTSDSHDDWLLYVNKHSMHCSSEAWLSYYSTMGSRITAELCDFMSSLTRPLITNRSVSVDTLVLQSCMESVQSGTAKTWLSLTCKEYLPDPRHTTDTSQWHESTPVSMVPFITNAL